MPTTKHFTVILLHYNHSRSWVKSQYFSIQQIHLREYLQQTLPDVETHLLDNHYSLLIAPQYSCNRVRPSPVGLDEG